MTRHTVVLFDIDGTLVGSAGAGKRAVKAAFEKLHGRPEAMDGVYSLGGMTDRAIMRLGLDAIGVDSSVEAIDALIATYLLALAHELEVAGGSRVKPGVEAAVDACLARSDFATGLGTGNVKAGAKLKLESAGIFDRFSFGGFGCDDERRPILLQIGARRGAALLGCEPDECRVVVVGDTPRDVLAAKAIGAKCVGVATGPYAAEVLEEAGADHVFSNLLTAGAVESILG